MSVVREIEGKEYSFRMTRKSVRKAEEAGMRVSSMGDTPMLALYYLWFAAIIADQPMPKGKSDDLLDAYLDDENCGESFEDILSSLGEEYAEVLA